jgi:hypothetical protein
MNTEQVSDHTIQWPSIRENYTLPRSPSMDLPIRTTNSGQLTYSVFARNLDRTRSETEQRPRNEPREINETHFAFIRVFGTNPTSD